MKYLKKNFLLKLFLINQIYLKAQISLNTNNQKKTFQEKLEILFLKKHPYYNGFFGFIIDNNGQNTCMFEAFFTYLFFKNVKSFYFLEKKEDFLKMKYFSYLIVLNFKFKLIIDNYQNLNQINIDPSFYSSIKICLSEYKNEKTFSKKEFCQFLENQKIEEIEKIEKKNQLIINSIFEKMEKEKINSEKERKILNILNIIYNLFNKFKFLKNENKTHDMFKVLYLIKKKNHLFEIEKKINSNLSNFFLEKKQTISEIKIIYMNYIIYKIIKKIKIHIKYIEDILFQNLKNATKYSDLILKLRKKIFVMEEKFLKNISFFQNNIFIKKVIEIEITDVIKIKFKQKYIEQFFKKFSKECSYKEKYPYHIEKNQLLSFNILKEEAYIKYINDKTQSIFKDKKQIKIEDLWHNLLVENQEIKKIFLNFNIDKNNNNFMKLIFKMCEICRNHFSFFSYSFIPSFKNLFLEYPHLKIKNEYSPTIVDRQNCYMTSIQEKINHAVYSYAISTGFEKEKKIRIIIQDIENFKKEIKQDTFNILFKIEKFEFINEKYKNNNFQQKESVVLHNFINCFI